jgi:hypothetical protein
MPGDLRVHRREPPTWDALSRRDLEPRRARLPAPRGRDAGICEPVWVQPPRVLRYERMDEAIAREKQIKAGSRAKKIALIQSMNPDWKDLYATLA